MSCLKHSALDNLYKWRLNPCDQIFLPECTALGMPLASAWACNFEAITHLRMGHTFNLPFLSSAVLSTESCGQTHEWCILGGRCLWSLFPPVSELNCMWLPLRTGWRQRNSDWKLWKDSFLCDPVEETSSLTPGVSLC